MSIFLNKRHRNNVFLLPPLSLTRTLAHTQILCLTDSAARQGRAWAELSEVGSQRSQLRALGMSLWLSFFLQSSPIAASAVVLWTGGTLCAEQLGSLPPEHTWWWVCVVLLRSCWNGLCPWCLPFRAERSVPSDDFTVTRVLPWRSLPGPCTCVAFPRGPAWVVFCGSAPRFSLKPAPPVQRAAVGFQYSGCLAFRALGIYC